VRGYVTASIMQCSSDLENFFNTDDFRINSHEALKSLINSQQLGIFLDFLVNDGRALRFIRSRFSVLS
jgi:hypothetical protein